MIGGLITHLWQSTVFAIAAALLTLAFRKNRAHVRYWLWLSASLKFFIPFALLIGFGGRLGWEPVAQKIATPAVSFAVEYVAQPFPATISLAPPTVHRDWTPFPIVGLWLIGCSAITLIRLRLWLRVRAAIRGSVPLEIPSSVQIRSAEGLLEPGVVGLWRPTLLLPEGIVERLTSSELEAVMAHELCHVRRRDNLFSSIHMLVEALFWFHPMVWWIGARLLEERERACDECVLSLGNQPRVYADAILNVCRLYTESPLVCVSGVTGSDIKLRIEAIMMNRIGLSLNRAKKLLLASAAVAALAGPVAVGVLIAAGHLPAIHAQSPAAPPVQIAQAAQVKPLAPVKTDAPPASYQDHRLVAMLFDFGGMTPDEQSRSRQAGIQYVENSMKPADLVSVMGAGPVTVAQDFTDNKSVLESVIQNLSAGTSAADVDSRLATIETASKMLAPLPGKKTVIYFSSGIAQTGADNQPRLREALTAATTANVAIYPIDARGIGSQAGAAVTRPAHMSQDAYNARVAGAKSFRNPEIARTYTMYGYPDQIESNPNAQAPSEIWRYNYLPNFHSSAEFQFSEGSHKNINYPPPATYSGTIAGATAIGLPGRHTSMGVYPAGEYSKLSVPLDTLSGIVDITGQIKVRAALGAEDHVVTDFHDSVTLNGTLQSGMYATEFLMEAGSYVCRVLVREAATGRVFAEVIDFDVK